MFARGVQVITLEMKFSQFMFQLMKIEAEIDHGAEKHIAAHAAENVEVKSFHELAGSSIF